MVGTNVRTLAIVAVVSMLVFSAVLYVGTTGALRPGSRTQPALGGAAIVLWPTSGPASASVRVNLTGFPGGDQPQVNLTNASVPGYNIESDPFFYLSGSGSASQPFTPAYLGESAGTYVYTAWDSASGITVSADYTVSPGNTTLSAVPSTGCSGSSVSLSGTGFEDGDSYRAYIGPTPGSPGYASVASGTVSPTGTISAGITIPTIASGTYVLFAQDSYGNYSATTFTCAAAPAAVTLSPAAGPMGASVAVSGTGFAPSSSIAASATPNNAGPTTICAGAMTDPTGAFTCDFTVPASAGATSVSVSAVDGSGDQGLATYAIVAPSLTIRPGTGVPGASVTTTGAGFAPSSAVSVSLASTGAGCASVTSPTGAFSCSFSVPAVTGGSYGATAMDTSDNQATASFVVETPGAPTSCSFPAPSGGPYFGFPIYTLYTVIDKHIHSDGVVLNTWSVCVQPGPGGLGVIFNVSANQTTRSNQLYDRVLQGYVFTLDMEEVVHNPAESPLGGIENFTSCLGSFVSLSGGSGGPGVYEFSFSCGGISATNPHGTNGVVDVNGNPLDLLHLSGLPGIPAAIDNPQSLLAYAGSGVETFALTPSGLSVTVNTSMLSPYFALLEQNKKVTLKLNEIDLQQYGPAVVTTITLTDAYLTEFVLTGVAGGGPVAYLGFDYSGQSISTTT